VGGEIKRKSLGAFSFSHLFFSKQRIKVWAIKHFLDMMSPFSRHFVSEQMARHFCLDTVRTKRLRTPPSFCVYSSILMSLRVSCQSE
jgi:hypothetical protein